MNKTATITDNEVKMSDGLAVIYTKLLNLASETYANNQISSNNIQQIASLVNLVRVSILGQFHEEGKQEMGKALTSAIQNIEEIQTV